MKKFIQLCSLFAVLVLFGAVAANAQSDFGTEVDIPFEFSVGDRSYEAGKYIVKLRKLSNGVQTLSIQDVETDDIQVVLLNAKGGSTEKAVKLVFDVHEGRRYLSRINALEQTYSLFNARPSKSERAAAGSNAF